MATLKHRFCARPLFTYPTLVQTRETWLSLSVPLRPPSPPRSRVQACPAATPCGTESGSRTSQGYSLLQRPWSGSLTGCGMPSRVPRSTWTRPTIQVHPSRQHTEFGMKCNERKQVFCVRCLLSTLPKPPQQWTPRPSSTSCVTSRS